MTEPAPKHRSTLVISNYWHRPQIIVTVYQHDEEAPSGAIRIDLDLEDFKRAVAAEMPAAWRILTRARRERATQAAVTSALEKIKLASTAAFS